jgi:hypothetical protein
MQFNCASEALKAMLRGVSKAPIALRALVDDWRRHHPRRVVVRMCSVARAVAGHAETIGGTDEDGFQLYFNEVLR